MKDRQRQRRYYYMDQRGKRVDLFVLGIVVLAFLFLGACTTARHYPPAPKWQAYELRFDERIYQ